MINLRRFLKPKQVTTVRASSKAQQEATRKSKDKHDQLIAEVEAYGGLAPRTPAQARAGL